MRYFDLNDAHVVAFAVVETGKPKPNCWTLCEVRARTQMQRQPPWPGRSLHLITSVVSGVECPTPLCSLSWWGWGGVTPEFPKGLKGLWADWVGREEGCPQLGGAVMPRLHVAV